MDSIRQKLNQSSMELKIAVFCTVIMGLSIVYKMIDPTLGEMVTKVSIATFCMSLLVFVYKFIFGKMGIIIVLSFISLYVVSMGVIFGMRELVYGGVVFVLVMIALKAFIWIFFKKKDNPGDELKDDPEDNR